MDNGNMQVGLLLTLQEDPPQTLFSARSVATMTHPRPFAPTARQRWATTALQYFKEMDVITTRRQRVQEMREEETMQQHQQPQQQRENQRPRAEEKGSRMPRATRPQRRRPR